MAGNVQWEVQIDSNIARILNEAKELRGELSGVKKESNNIKVNIDGKKIEKIISELDEIYNKFKGNEKINFFEFEHISNELDSLKYKFKVLNQEMDLLTKSTVDTSSFHNLETQLTFLISRVDDFDSAIKKLNSSSSQIGNDIINEKSLNNIIDLFTKIESNLSSMRAIFADVGDGEEFSPLLNMINKIDQSIKEMSTSVKGIGLNMNIDVGSNKELETQFEEKAAKALIAYQRLFDHIKSTTSSQFVFDEFNKFNLNNFDTTFAKVKGIANFIEKIRTDSKSLYNNHDVLKEDTVSSKYWNSASRAMGEMSGVLKKMNTATNTNSLENLFGKTNLTEVVSQLNLIVQKLGEISSAASELKTAFANGLNVTTSVEEINKLTSKVKELENELAKVKTTSSTSPVETNTSSPIKDTFQGDKIQETVNSARELDRTLEGVEIPKENFDEVINKLKLAEIKAKDIVKITKQMRIGEDGKPIESYTLKDKYGSTEIYGVSSNKEKGQLLSANYVQYDAKQAEKLQKDFNKAYEEATKINNALTETKGKLDGLSKHPELSSQFSEVETTIKSLNTQLTQGEISVSEYNKAVKETTSNYSKLVSIQQKRDTEIYNANTKQAEAWEKNLKAIQEYMDANTKLNKLMAKDKGTGKHASDIARQEKEVEKLKEAAIEARATLSSMVNPHEAPVDDWNKWIEVMEKFEQATKGSVESVAKLEDALRSARNAQLSSIDTTISNGQSKLDEFSTRKDKSDVYQNKLKELGETLERLRTLKSSLSNTRAFTREEQEQVDNLTQSIRTCIKEIGRMSADEKGSSEISRFKLLDKIADYMKKNTRMSREFKAELEDLMNILRTGGANVQVGEILAQFEKIKDKIRLAKQEGVSFFDIFKNKAVYGFAARLAQYYLSFYDWIRYTRYAINALVELDSALLDLKKTTSMTGNQLEDFYYASNDVAKQMGVTTAEIIEQASAWSRLGYGTEEAATKMAQLSSQFASISPGMETDQAQEGLVSIMKAWDIDPDEVESEIMDNINILGKQKLPKHTVMYGV